mgnify:CR=1 FL=1
MPNTTPSPCGRKMNAIVNPTTNALMSHRIAADAQGELQGAIASLYSLSSIVGPPLMTQLFGRFSAPDAPIYLPGAAFLAATLLAMASLVIYWLVTRGGTPRREPGVRHRGDVAHANGAPLGVGDDELVDVLRGERGRQRRDPA